MTDRPRDPAPPGSPAAPLVSIVWLNYNGQRHTPLWSSLFEESYARKEIIFVDNGSTDGSSQAFEALARDHPSVQARLLRLEKNVGYSQGNNRGVEEARGEIVALLNNDVRVAGTWVQPVLEAFRSDPTIGVAQSLLFSTEAPTQPDRVFNRIDCFGFAHPAPPLTGDLPEVFYVEGAAFFLRRRLLEELGYLYPPEFFMLFEDVDLCWRARLLGWRSVVVPGSRAWHARGGTEPGAVTKRNPRLLEAVTRNRLATLYTNLGTGRLALFLPLSMLLAVGRAMLLWRRGRGDLARKVLGGVARFLRDGGLLRERRRAVQARRKVRDRDVARLMMGPGEALRALRGLWRETSAEG